MLVLSEMLLIKYKVFKVNVVDVFEKYFDGFRFKPVAKQMMER